MIDGNLTSAVDFGRFNHFLIILLTLVWSYLIVAVGMSLSPGGSVVKLGNALESTFILTLDGLVINLSTEITIDLGLKSADWAATH